MPRSQRNLAIVLFVFAAASLVHFIHNAEFLADYPNLPGRGYAKASISRGPASPWSGSSGGS